MDNTPNSTVSPADIPEDRRIKAALAYVLLWVTGLIMLLIEPQDKFIKFHAMQAILLGLVLTVLGWIPCIGWTIAFVGWLYALYGAYIVYTGRPFRIPHIAEFVEKNLL